jgi:hypothetical protein
MKDFLILMFALLSYGLYAQQRDFAWFNHRIDSLTSVYSTKEWQDMVYGNYFDGSNLTSKEKKKLIAKVRKFFEQEMYPNLYRYGHRVIYEMWWMYPDNNSLEIKQKLMELYLRYYFYPGADGIINSYDINGKFYYSKKAKERIVEILENKKNKKEYEARLNYEKFLPENIIRNKWVAEELIKEQKIQNDTIIQQIRDSISMEYVNKVTQRMLELQQIEPHLIRMIGLLDMKECVPVLKKNLQECIQNECSGERRKAYRYALARLGDKEQRQYIIDSLMDAEKFDRRDFSYFQDDEMIREYIEVNYHSNKRFFPFSEGEGIPAELKTMSDIYPYIKNIPEGLNYSNLRGGVEVDIEWAKSLYEWLTANKDMVEFDYEGEEVFPR